MARNPTYYNVRPRYTPGSPAQVPQETAERVAEEERHGWEVSLSGAYGHANVEVAKVCGLAGIVEARVEYRKGWKVHDLLTNERFWRPFKWKRGDKVQVFIDESRGFVPGEVVEADSHEAKVYVPCKDPNDGHPYYAGIRSPQAVLAIEGWRLRPAQTEVSCG